MAVDAYVGKEAKFYFNICADAGIKYQVRIGTLSTDKAISVYSTADPYWTWTPKLEHKGIHYIPFLLFIVNDPNDQWISDRGTVAVKVSQAARFLPGYGLLEK